MELTCPLDSVENLQSAREPKQEKREYLEIQSELDRLGVSCKVSCSYNTIELSVLGHYLTSSLSSLQSRINFITENTITKSSCMDQAASISISSSRIFLAKNCLEWTFEC